MCIRDRDDGIGMSADYQKTLFDPFTREERSGTNKVQGKMCIRDSTGTQRHTDKNIGQRSTGTNRRQCRGADKLTDYDGVRHVIDLSLIHI